jgi:hypothetical protein
MTRFEVVCQDGQVRHAPFTTRREADAWAWWGHICAAKHEVNEVQVPAECPFGAGDPFRVVIPTDVKRTTGNVVVPAGEYWAWAYPDDDEFASPGSVCVWTEGKHFAGVEWASVGRRRYRKVS